MLGLEVLRNKTEAWWNLVPAQLAGQVRLISTLGICAGSNGCGVVPVSNSWQLDTLQILKHPMDL